MKLTPIYALGFVLAMGVPSAFAAATNDGDGAGTQGGVPGSTQSEPMGRDIDDVGVNTGSDVTDGTATSDGTGIADGMGKLDNGPTPAIGEPGEGEREQIER